MPSPERRYREIEIKPIAPRPCWPLQPMEPVRVPIEIPAEPGPDVPGWIESPEEEPVTPDLIPA